jgi:hypothetical protein
LTDERTNIQCYFTSGNSISQAARREVIERTNSVKRHFNVAEIEVFEKLQVTAVSIANGSGLDDRRVGFRVPEV